MGSEREERPRKKKKKSKAGYYLYAVVVLILAVAIVVISMLLLFHVQKIEVTGNEYSGKKEIVDWVREDPYTSNALYAMVKFKTGSYKKPVYLEQVDVSMKAPWELKVTVKEKKIIGCIISDNDYVYFDEEGLVLVKGSEMIDGIPVIEGLEVGNAEKYEKLTVDNEKVFSYIVSISETLKKNELSPDRLVWEEDSMNLYFQNICVKLGKNNFDEKVTEIPPIIEKLEGKSGVLDMEHYNETSKNISFREEQVTEQTEPQTEDSAEKQ